MKSDDTPITVTNGNSKIGTKRTLSFKYYLDGFVQDCSISIVNALEIVQSCNKPFVPYRHDLLHEEPRYRQYCPGYRGYSGASEAVVNDIRFIFADFFFIMYKHICISIVFIDTYYHLIILVCFIFNSRTAFKLI